MLAGRLSAFWRFLGFMLAATSRLPPLTALLHRSRQPSMGA